MMTAILAEHGISVMSVEAMMRSRLPVKILVPIMAGTLQPVPEIIGIMARPLKADWAHNRVGEISCDV